MAITKQQIQTALTVTAQLQTEVTRLFNIINYVNTLSQNNWVLNQSVTNVSVNLTVDAPTQSALINAYTSEKAALLALYNQLP